MPQRTVQSVTLRVPRLESARRFYQEIVGLEVVEEGLSRTLNACLDDAHEVVVVLDAAEGPMPQTTFVVTRDDLARSLAKHPDPVLGLAHSHLAWGPPWPSGPSFQRLYNPGRGCALGVYTRRAGYRSQS